MNHHTRSYSEQPQVAPQAATTGINGQPNNGLAQPQSIVRNHLDIRQSLEQLFNPTLTTSVPLRNRNLPSSFFNPSVKTENGTNGTPPTNGNFHNRSISFDQHNPNVPQAHRPNFHSRTHSTLAPMPRLDSNHSSHQSSREFLNTTTTPNASNNNINNVSSCHQHSENIVSSTSTNNQNHHNHHHHHNHHQQHHIHLNSHSNAWSSVRDSVDDLSSTSWAANQQERPVVAHQPMQVVHHHQPMIMHEHAVQVQPTHQAQQHQHQTATNIIADNHQSMFYGAAQQTVVAADTTTTPMVATTQHVCPNHSFHNRSVSYHQHPAPAVTDMRVNHGFHMRTHSTAAPVSSTCLHHHQPQITSHHSSHQSSLEVLNHSSATNSSAAAGWSSSGYSTDDMTSAGAGHNWAPNNQHHHPAQPQLHITQQPPTMDHQPTAGPHLSVLSSGHNHHNHHIPLQVQQQTAHPIASQQLFHNV